MQTDQRVDNYAYAYYGLPGRLCLPMSFICASYGLYVSFLCASHGRHVRFLWASFAHLSSLCLLLVYILLAVCWLLPCNLLTAWAACGLPMVFLWTCSLLVCYLLAACSMYAKAKPAMQATQATQASATRAMLCCASLCWFCCGGFALTRTHYAAYTSRRGI